MEKTLTYRIYSKNSRNNSIANDNNNNKKINEYIQDVSKVRSDCKLYFGQSI